MELIFYRIFFILRPAEFISASNNKKAVPI